MAKKTKSADLSIEEKLEQALIVPGYEPYKIPDNWCWTSFKNVAEVVTGGTPSKKHKEYYGNVFPFFKPADLNTGRNVSIASEYLSEEGKKVSRVIPAKSTLVCCIGSIGKSGFLEIEGSTNQQINSAIPKIEPLYLYYYVNTDCFINQLWSKSSATTISIVNKTKMEECYFPLAPLPEQQRIVGRIESLFSKLDEAKEKAQEVIDSFETRKAAILHKAFSGELTAKWREENGVGIESWESTKIGNMLTEIKYGTSEKSDYSFDGIPVFRIPNIGDMTLIFDDVKKIQRQECSENEYLSENDILIIRSNGSKELVGKCALVPKINFKCTYASFLIRLRMKDSISSLYTVWYLTSEQARKQLFNKAKSSAGIHNINSKEISDISIVVPSKPEQNIITATLERLITKEKETVIFAESIIDQIETMKKAILARAFRGELGTNDPKEESAVELLKQILSGE